MFVIGNTLVSIDLIERYFVCDLEICKGQCCIDGDAGAPLLNEEKETLDENINAILPLLPPGGEKAIKENGTAYIDNDGDLVTTLVEGCNCAFTVFTSDGTCLCGLEKGYREGKLPFLKPSSCSLYPVRLQKVGDMTAVNLHRWKICKCAEKKGKELGVRAYEFLKEPLIRKFGQEWYDELQHIADEWLRQKNEKC